MSVSAAVTAAVNEINQIAANITPVMNTPAQGQSATIALDRIALALESLAASATTANTKLQAIADAITNHA